MGLICALAWQFLVVWAAMRIGFSLQVIDSMRIPVRDSSVCQLIGQPIADGACILTGRAVARLDGTWTVTSLTEETVTLSNITSGFLYDPAQWHMLGGWIASAALIIVATVLMLLPVLVLKPKLHMFKRLRGLAAK